MCKKLYFVSLIQPVCAVTESCGHC